MNRRVKIFVAVLVVVVLGAAVLGAVVLAQEPTPTPTKPRQSLQQTYWQTLADKLGVKVEVLQQDARDAARETVQQAVNDGVLTQKQADALLRRLDQQAPGALPFGGPFRGRGWRPGWHRGRGFGPVFGRQSVLDAAAKALGMTSQDLVAELKAGKSLADIAEEKGVVEDAVKRAVLDALKAQLDQAVKDGRLTQTQAEQMKTRMEQVLEQGWPFFGRFFKGRPFWGKRF